jgi:legumain
MHLLRPQLRAGVALMALWALTSLLSGCEGTLWFRPRVPKGQEASHWALLIAGSRGWSNYRHQADICHAYHALRGGGVPARNIVVMMADDLAHHPSNPTPGKIINRPDGPDVYAGVPADYSGEAVTSANFLAVLAGNRTRMQGIGSGKVLATGPTDTVFVYFSDHGGVLSLGMPYGPLLQAHDLVDTLKAKAAAKGFAKMTVYVEACHAGSMFEGLLPTDLNIYVTTASRGDESSYGTYCPPDGPLDTCLGDLYSVAFLENEDVVDLRESLAAQYDTVRARTSNNHTYYLGSHVVQWGTTALDAHAVGEFMGDLPNQPATRDLKAPPQPRAPPPATPVGRSHNVAQHDAELLHYTYRYLRATGDRKFAALRELQAEVGRRTWLEDAVTALAATLLGPHRATGRALLQVPPAMAPGRDVPPECFAALLSAWDRHCGGSPQYLLRFTHVFAQICADGVPADQGAAAVRGVCERAWRARPLE